MHDWFLTACLLGFCQQDKNVWKIWEISFNLSVWPLALLWRCRFAGNRREEYLGIFMSFHCFSHYILWEQVSSVCSAQAVLLLWSLWSVRSHSIPYTAVCCFPSSHNNLWMLLLTIFAEELRNNHVLTRISMQQADISVLQKNNFCLAVRFVLKALVKFSVDCFSYTAIHSWDLAGSAITLHLFLLGRKEIRISVI